MVVNLSIAAHTLLIRMLTSLSVDEILLPWYVNWFTNFKGLSFNLFLSTMPLNQLMADLVCFHCLTCNVSQKKMCHVISVIF